MHGGDVGEENARANAHHVRQLQRLAARLAGPSTHWPRLWLFTDPQRLADPRPIMAAAAPGLGIVFRHFGAGNAAEIGAELRRCARRHGHLFFIGEDWRLAAALRADGVHLPERCAHRAGALARAFPHWRISAAAHSPRAIRRAVAFGAQALFVSPVFASNSRSAGQAIGESRLAAWTKAYAQDLPVFALGGVNTRTAPRLINTGLAGFAAIEAFAKSVDIG